MIDQLIEFAKMADAASEDGRPVQLVLGKDGIVIEAKKLLRDGNWVGHRHQINWQALATRSDFEGEIAFTIRMLEEQSR